MPANSKRGRKKQLDEPRLATTKAASPEKDPLAVELGRRGGLKGGKARAKKLSAKKRKQIAQRAARARWKRAR